MTRGRHSFIAAAALVAPSPLIGQPASEAFCVELRTIVAAALETPAFASFGPEPWLPRAALTFRDCSVLEMLEGHPSFGCAGESMDSYGRWRRLVADIPRCLPAAMPTGPRSGSRHVPPINQAHFRAGRVWIIASEQPVGFDGRRDVSLRIAPEPIE